MSSTPPKVTCPRCGAKDIQALKKGFGAGKAVGGAVVVGPVGLLAGFIGSRKVQIVCLRCGHKWAPSPRSTGRVRRDSGDYLKGIRLDDPAYPTGSEKTCPMCAEKVKSAAKICRFCGHSFETSRKQ